MAVRATGLPFLLVALLHLPGIYGSWCGDHGGNATWWEDRSAAALWRQANTSKWRNIIASRKPSARCPFVFLHVPKTGGTTIRAQLHAAVPEGERLAPIGGILPKHELYDDSVGRYQLQHAHLLAGHLTWGTLKRIELTTSRFDCELGKQTAISESISDFANSMPAYACMTLVRHPVDRVISYWYNRISHERRISDSDPEELRSVLEFFRKDGSKRFRGHHDEGPLNPTSKALCGQWTAGGEHSKEFGTIKGCSRSEQQRRLGRCWVGVIDDWARSCRVLRQQLPWLRLDCLSRKNVGTVGPRGSQAGFRHEQPAELPPAILKTIVALNQDDLALYEAAKRQLDQDYEKLFGQT